MGSDYFDAARNKNVKKFLATIQGRAASQEEQSDTGIYSPCGKDCPHCHGLGYVGYDVPTSDPRFGRLYLCPTLYAVTWDDTIGFPVFEAARLNWRNFNKTTDQAKMIQKAIAGLLREGHGMAYIYGPPGLGKTLHAKSACIIAHYKHNKTARYMTQTKLMDWLRTSFDDKLRSQTRYVDMLKEIEGIDFLVVDEVGRINPTDFAITAWSEIVDRRYTAADRKTTIWLSNMPPDIALDDYQVDRMRDNRFSVLHIDGVSYRQTDVRIEEDELWWQKL